jgi:hypothetical protein
VSLAARANANVAFTLPEVDGLLGHAVVTDGSGNLSLTEVGRGNVVASTVSRSLAFYTGVVTPGDLGKSNPSPIFKTGFY